MHEKLYSTLAVRYAGDVLTFFGVGFAIWARWGTLGRYWSGLVMLKQGPQAFIPRRSLSLHPDTRSYNLALSSPHSGAPSPQHKSMVTSDS